MEASDASTTSASPSSSSAVGTIRDDELPFATAPRPFTTKKSHARKQPAGHIPRPRNAFILFRCDYSRQKQDAIREDWDQNDLSRAVGQIWRSMTTAQRAPWVLLAEEEKKRHAILYPGYKYMPRNRKAPPPTEAFVKKQFVREANRVVARERKAQEEEDLRGTVTIYYPPWATRRARVFYGRRATSCPPPGAVAVTPYSERVDRACVTVHDSRPSSPVSDTDSDIFLPLIEVPCKPSWEVQPDEELSRPAIENPVGTHWGTVPASPTDYRMQGDVPVMQPKESYYVPRRHTQTLSEDVRYRPISSSTSAGSTTPPPRTPTDVDFIAPLVYAGNNHMQQDFVSEFGSMLQAVPVVSPRESFLRTTYTNAFEGYE